LIVLIIYERNGAIIKKLENLIELARVRWKILLNNRNLIWPIAFLNYLF